LKISGGRESIAVWYRAAPTALSAPSVIEQIAVFCSRLVVRVNRIGSPISISPARETTMTYSLFDKSGFQ